MPMKWPNLLKRIGTAFSAVGTMHHRRHQSTTTGPPGSAIEAHVEAIGRMLNVHGMRPETGLFLSSFFYEDEDGNIYIFSNTSTSKRTRYSRWQIDRGDLSPFRITDRHLPGLVKYMRDELVFDEQEIVDVLNIDKYRVKAALAYTS